MMRQVQRVTHCQMNSGRCKNASTHVLRTTGKIGTFIAFGATGCPVIERPTPKRTVYACSNDRCQRGIQMMADRCGGTVKALGRVGGIR